jgi:hypothetical protein
MNLQTRMVIALTLGLTCSGTIAAHSKAGPSQTLEFKTLVIGGPTSPAQVEAALTTPCGMPGGPYDELDKKLQEMRRLKCGAGGDGMQVCNGTTTIAGSLAEVNVVIGSDGTLQRIHLTLSDLGYDDVEQALISKFGTAQRVSHPTLQNGFGATFRQEESLWIGANSTQLLLNKYAGDTGHGDVYFSTQQDRDLMTGKNQAPSSDL